MTEAELSFPRKKPYWFTLSLLARLVALARVVFGYTRVLRWLLNLNWLTWRFAFEAAGLQYGDVLCDDGWCVSDELLSQVLPAGAAVASVIDIGCAGGRLCRMSARHAGRVLGIDRDVFAIASATQWNHRPERIEYRVGNLLTDQVMIHEHFDLALLVNVLEHLEDVDAMLTRIRQIARTLIVEVPDIASSPLNQIRQRLGAVWYTDRDHVREYDRELLRTHLERNGWTPKAWVFKGGNMCVVAQHG